MGIAGTPGGTNPSKLEGNFSYSGIVLQNGVNSFFQTRVLVTPEDDTEHDVQFGYGYKSGTTWVVGYGFRQVNYVTYGFFYINSTITEIELGDDYWNGAFTYRAQYDAASGYVTFYINGVQVGSISRGAYTFNYAAYFSYYAKSNGTEMVYCESPYLLVGAGY